MVYALKLCINLDTLLNKLLEESQHLKYFYSLKL